MAQHSNGLGVNTPIFPSQTFPVDDPYVIATCFAAGIPSGMYIYGRFGHPNYSLLERILANLECAERTLLFASGLGASAALFMSVLSSGDHVVVSRNLYGGTRGQLAFLAQKMGVGVSVVDVCNLADVEAALDKPGTKLCFVESISNPELVVAPIEEIAQLCKAKGRNVLFAVDNTFASCFIKPIMHGADAVIHSLTKYMSGRSDVMGGALIGSTSLIDSIVHPSSGAGPLLGSVMHYAVAHELAMRIHDLAHHVCEASVRAERVADMLKGDGFDVRYPTMNTSPIGGASTLRGLRVPSLSLGGGVVSVGFSSEDEGVRFLNTVASETFSRHGEIGPLAIPAVSLGSSHTYVWCFTEARVKKIQALTPLPFAPIPYGFVRIAIGYEGEAHDVFLAWRRAIDAFRAGARP
jgi:methionine-gamma-lyase